MRTSPAATGEPIYEQTEHFAMTFWTLAVSGTQRVTAVHKEFAGRTTEDLLRMLMLVGGAMAVLFAALLLVNYVQQRSRRRAEAQHRVEMQAKLRRPGRRQLYS